MKIFSNDEIQAIEQYTIDNEGVSPIDFIERAGDAIAAEVMNFCRPNVRILVFAGWGNNGADALETARLLLIQGYDPEIYLFNIGGNRMSAECSICRERLLESAPSARILEITGRERFSWPEPDASCVIIDGLFGGEVHEKLPIPFQVLIRNINQSGATVISIDLPSGMTGDWNSHTSRENIIHATMTMALGVPRLSFFIEDNDEFLGRWKIVDIGLSTEAIKNAPFTYFLIQKNDTRRYLTARGRFSTKRDYGHALIAAGSYGMTGAAILSSRAAIRAGAGKVTVHAPRCSFIPLQTATPSAMYDADRGEQFITQVPTDTRYTAVGVGPGLGGSDATIDAIEGFLKNMSAASRPVVIDADALNAIAKRQTLLNYLPPLSVLTPHAGEFDRIFGECHTQEARLIKAIDAARYYNIIIVLKGHYSAIVRPDGKVFFNSTGGPELATPGSGDVLTGVITGLMAQGMKPEIAAFVGCYIHGRAGELASEIHGEYGVSAEDVANNIGRAIKDVM
jgi:NAD(P)H-hydrate epimerase